MSDPMDAFVEDFSDAGLINLLASASSELNSRRESEATNRVCDAVDELIDAEAVPR